MKAKFTKGPWAASFGSHDCYIDSVEGGLIADLSRSDASVLESDSNAQLIATAPEMYDEIKIEIEELQDFILTLEHMSNDWLYYSSRLDRKEALLAKARGE